MQKLFIVVVLLFLSSCGTIGIASNDVVNVYNDSDNIITIEGKDGMRKINPKSFGKVSGNTHLYINSENKNCSPMIIPPEINKTALILDIFPGAMFAFIPLFVDFAIGGLDNMPENYTFECL